MTNVSKWLLLKRTRNVPSQGELIQRLEELLELRVQTTKELFKQINAVRISKLLRWKRKILKEFLKSLRSRTGAVHEEILNNINFDAVLEAFPIWLVKLSDISKVLPLKKELFDVLIIDEANNVIFPAVFLFYSVQKEL